MRDPRAHPELRVRTAFVGRPVILGTYLVELKTTARELKTGNVCQAQMRQRAPAGGGLGRVHAAPLKLVVLVLYAAGLMVGGAAPMSSAPDRRSLEPTRLASALPATA